VGTFPSLPSVPDDFSDDTEEALPFQEDEPSTAEQPNQVRPQPISVIVPNESSEAMSDSEMSVDPSEEDVEVDEGGSEDRLVYGGPDLFSPVWNQQLPKPKAEAPPPNESISELFEDEEFDGGPTWIEQGIDLLRDTLSDPYKAFIIGGGFVILVLLVAVFQLL